MGNSPKLEKSGKRGADASSSDIPLVAWKDASRTMPVNTTEPDCVRVNRAKACAHTSSQPNSDDLVDDGHRLRVAENAHTCDIKGKKMLVSLSMQLVKKLGCTTKDIRDYGA
ncbi:tumor necrosis factor receptor superfamily member6 [Striga asiatica]|uniref:Tumor necrosis factor receptor superfamily member6 n=1 Tax=Striga asiatica TaxID=4170 RepID=A0A5A7PHV6_STRAF|nr:tumor necrosis factor receptor superfamily member6 [Striga asiatica]